MALTRTFSSWRRTKGDTRFPEMDRTARDGALFPGLLTSASAKKLADELLDLR